MTYEMTCHHCGTQFEATRSDAKFCSDNCRTGAKQKRQRDQLRKLSAQGENALAASSEFKEITNLFDQIAVLIADLRSKAV